MGQVRRMGCVRRAAALSIFIGLAAGAARAESPPMPAPAVPSLPPLVDAPFPGTLGLAVDATDVDHGVFSVRETIPVAGLKEITLLFPKWLPGNHSPSGPIDMLAGLVLTADGAQTPWRRDPVEITAFHVTLPASARELTAAFQYLSPVTDHEGRVVMTKEMLNVEWNAVALYPAGVFTRDIQVAASVRLPEGFRPFTALETASTQGAVVTFKPTTFETLVDSPLIAGKYARRVDLGQTGGAPVYLDIIADKASELEATPAQLQAHRDLVRQAERLFASHHYDHYDFLFSLSDRMGEEGLEHHQSSEDGSAPKYFTDWAKTPAERDLLAHEYTHSWNGKFRRPKDLWTANFNTPMGDSLLWVYEGQTQYWGYVLAARAGLLTEQETLDAIALTAATYDQRIGRTWRDLEDTDYDPIIAGRRPLPWRSWQRSEDYYSEGQLVWLDADTLIRERTGGAKSLDDFAKIFFGVHNGSFTPDTYDFDDVVKALNAVTPFDWRAFLKTRLQGHGPGAPLDGLARGGWRLVYTDTETDYQKSVEGRRKATDLMFSIGASFDKDGKLTEVLWDGPAFKAGLSVGVQVVAVDGDAFDADALKDRVKATLTNAAPIRLLVKSKDAFSTVDVVYRGGLRYPRLERIAATPDRLGEILKPKT